MAEAKSAEAASWLFRLMHRRLLEGLLPPPDAIVQVRPVSLGHEAMQEKPVAWISLRRPNSERAKLPRECIVAVSGVESSLALIHTI